MSRPPFGGDQCEDGADGRGFHNRQERLAKVDARLLVKATDHLPRFVPVEGAVGVEFRLEHPFAGDDPCAEGARHKCPNPVGLESGELLLHCIPPVGVAESCSNRRGRGGDDRSRGCERELRVRLDDARTSSSRHVVSNRHRSSRWCGSGSQRRRWWRRSGGSRSRRGDPRRRWRSRGWQLDDDGVVIGWRGRRRWSARHGDGLEREDLFVEDDMARGEDSPRGDVVAPVPVVVAGVANEDAR